jgi:hypothetical protein
VALLPGSRALELRYIAPQIAGAVPLLRREFQNLHFVAAVPRGAAASTRKKFPADVSVVEDRAAQLLSACDVAIVKSGTSTLEAAVADAPQVVVYDGPKVMRLQAHIMGVRKRVPFVAMPNILVQRRIVPELLGEDCTSQNIDAKFRRCCKRVTRVLGCAPTMPWCGALWVKIYRLVPRSALRKSWMRCCMRSWVQSRRAHRRAAPNRILLKQVKLPVLLGTQNA